MRCESGNQCGDEGYECDSRASRARLENGCGDAE
jgi:hypothetical protein